MGEGALSNIVSTVPQAADTKPDLTFDGGISITSESQEVIDAIVGEALVIRAMLMNDGWTNVPSAQVQFIARDTDFNQYVIEMMSTSILANQTKVVEFDWTVNLTAGDYYLMLIADPSGLIDERSETNNLVSSYVFRIDPPAPDISIIVDKTTYTPGSDVVITGTVTNEADGETLINMMVELSIIRYPDYSQIGDTATAYTDSLGHYTKIKTLPSDIPLGFYAARANVTMGAGVHSAVCNAFEVVEASIVVIGLVVDSEGDPVAGATVTAGDQSTTTDDEGGFEIALPAGTYTVTATSGDRSKSVQFTVSEDNSNIGTISLPAETPSDDLAEWWLIVIVIVVIVILFFLFFIFWKRRKKDEEEEKKKQGG
jgi:hypothetical protein